MPRHRNIYFYFERIGCFISLPTGQQGAVGAEAAAPGVQSHRLWLVCEPFLAFGASGILDCYLSGRSAMTLGPHPGRCGCSACGEAATRPATGNERGRNARRSAAATMSEEMKTSLQQLKLCTASSQMWPAARCPWRSERTLIWNKSLGGAANQADFSIFAERSFNLNYKLPWPMCKVCKKICPVSSRGSC
jgi:hypothetical protein